MEKPSIDKTLETLTLIAKNARDAAEHLATVGRMAATKVNKAVRPPTAMETAHLLAASGNAHTRDSGLVLPAVDASDAQHEAARQQLSAMADVALQNCVMLSLELGTAMGLIKTADNNRG